MRKLNILKTLASSTVVVLASLVAVRADSTVYSTTFDSGKDIINDKVSTATYSSPNTPTDPLAGQGVAGLGGWTSNDHPASSGVGTTQIVGDSNYVADIGQLFMNSAAGSYTAVLGGIYRPTAATGPATTATPDVVPSTNATGGTSSLFHQVAVPAPFPRIVLAVDFSITASTAAHPALDTFSFTLGNGTNNLVAISFSPSTMNGTSVGGPTGRGLSDNITLTVGGNTLLVGGTQSGVGPNVIFLNQTYHLVVTIVNGTTGPNATAPTVTASFGNFAASGTLPPGVLNSSSITEIGALWKLEDTTVTAGTGGNPGSYQNAGDNYLAFDNILVTVPEPSTYATLALGVLGLVGLMRLRRQRA